MKEWWSKKRKRTRRARKPKDKYTSWDIIVDVLFWIPELLLLPFRILIWLFRGIAKSIFDIV